MISIVGDDVVTPLGDACHRLLRYLVEPRSVMEEHDDGERTVAVGPHDVDAHFGPLGVAISSVARLHPATLVRRHLGASSGASDAI